MKKMSGRVTAGMLVNYEESVKHFVSENKGFLLWIKLRRLLHAELGLKGKC